jgi:branched-chain amino acid transport system permease protein
MGTAISRHWPWLFLLAAAVLPMLFATDYRLLQLTLVVVYAVAVLGLNLVTGYNGQVSLGHGAFYAIGAYTTAILMDKAGMPYWGTLPFAAVICAAVGFLIGLPALRLGGMYLALTTFALAVATPQLLKYKAFEAYSGGVQGISLDKPEAPFGLPLNPDQWLYLFSLAVGAVIFVLATNLVRGRIGRAIRAIRDQPLAAEAMGINIAMYKTRTFAVSALFTGISGSLGAIAIQFVAPDAFGAPRSLDFFTGMVVGGGASIGGAVVGGLFIELVPNFADELSRLLAEIAPGIEKLPPGAIAGAILIAFMFLAPGGIAGLARGISRRRRSRRT